MDEERYIDSNNVDVLPECSTVSLVQKLQEADKKVLEIRENSYRTKIAVS